MNVKHVHIIKMFDLYNNESNPFRKVHRLIDLFETIIKTHTAVIIADYFRCKDISDNIKGLLAEGLRVPSLGTWQYFSREIIKEMNDKLMIPYIPDFYKYFFLWDKKYFSGGKVDIISFRNKYAHGATPDDTECLADISKYEPIMKEFLRAEWLNATLIVSFSSIGEQIVMIDLEDRSDIHLTTELIINLKEKEIQPLRAYLINKTGELLDLFPIIQPKLITKHKISVTSLLFFNDLKKKGAISLLSYPYALQLRDREMFAEFMEIVNIEAWKQKTTEEFNERIEELTEVFKGRSEERNLIKKWIINHHKGYLFIFGNPGVGKSSLIAQTLRELKQERSYEIDILEYFIRRGTEYSKPGKMMSSLSNILEARYNTGIEIGTTPDEMKINLDDRLRIISDIKERKKIVLLIDGLDEGSENEILRYLLNSTYNNIIVIYGTRWTDGIQSFYNRIPIEYKWREEIKGLKEEDIRAILYEVTDKYTITTNQIEEISKKSNGNPLYLKMLCMAIEDGEIQLQEGIKLPKQIEDFYKLFIERYSMLKDGDEILRSLYTFAAAKDFLTQKQLESILGLGESVSERVIMTLQEVLYENSESEIKEYQLFHESMRDFLLKQKYESVREAEERILSFCRNWDSYSTKEKLLYPLKHFAEHLYNFDEKEELFNLVLNRKYLSKQLEITEQYESSIKLIELAMKCWEDDSYKLLEMGIEAGRLSLSAQNSLAKIEKWIMDGGMENYQKALARILHYKEKDRVILYFLLLNRASDNENPEVVKLVLEKMDNDITRDTSLLIFTKILPLAYLIVVTAKLDEVYWPIVLERIPVIYVEQINNVIGIGYNKSRIKLMMQLVKMLMKYHDSSITIKSIVIELSKQGKVRDALAIAEEINNEENKKDVMQCIISELSKQGKGKEALAIIELIDDKYTKSQAMASIALELSRFNKEKEALAIIELIDNEYTKSKAIISISAELLKQKNTEKALTVAEMIEDKYEQSVILHSVSIELYGQGKIEESETVLQDALDVSNNIEDNLNKSKALQAIAAELYKRGKIEHSETVLRDALNVMNNIEDNLNKSKALQSIATELHKRGKGEESETVMRQARNVVENIDDEYDKDKALRSFIAEQIKQGYVEEGLAYAENYKDPYDKNKVLLYIVTELSKKGMKENALNIVELINEEYSKAIALESIAVELSRLNKEKEAFAIIELIDNEYTKSQALISFAAKLVKQNKIEEALTVTEMIEDMIKRSKALIEMADELIDQGKKEESIRVLKEALTDAIADAPADAKSLSSDHHIIINSILARLSTQNKGEDALHIIKNKYKSEYTEFDRYQLIITDMINRGKLKEVEFLIKSFLPVSEKLKVYIDTSETLGLIASELSIQGNVEKALVVSEKIEDTVNKSQALESIAVELSKQGKRENALIVANKIEIEPARRSYAYFIIATEFLKQSKIEDALAVTTKIEYQYYRSEALKSISIELVKQKRTKEALTVAEMIEDKYEQSVVLHSVSVELYGQGKIEESETVLRNTLKVSDYIEDNLKKAEVLQSIASELYKRGKRQESDILTRQVLNMLESVDDDYGKCDIFELIALEYINHGKIDKALAVSERIKDKKDKVEILRAIIIELTRQGREERALDIAVKIYRKDDKYEALKSIAIELSRQGKREKALDIVENIKYKIIKSEALQSIAVELSKHGMVRESLNVAEMIVYTYHYSHALKLISVELYNQGKSEESENIFKDALSSALNLKDNNVESSNHKSGTLQSIADILIKQGKMEESLSVIELIESNYKKSEALKSVSTELAKQDRMSYCRDIIELAPDGRSRIDVVKEFINNCDYNNLKTVEELFVNILSTNTDIIKMKTMIANRIFGKYNYDLYDILPRYLIPLHMNTEMLGKILIGAALYLRFIKDNITRTDKSILLKLNEIVEISGWLDWEQNNIYAYSKLSEWIGQIKDEDDLEQINLWRKRVEKGKMNEKEFEDNVNILIHDKKQ